MVVLVSVVFFLCAVPFVQAPLLAVPAFIPAYEASLVFIELITAVLLLAQYSRTSSSRMLVLAAGYLFNTGIVFMHALSFPGVFGPAGILGGSAQTAVWIYTFWHLGFPAVCPRFCAAGGRCPSCA